MAVVEEQESICENLNVGETGTIDPGGNVDELLVEEVRKHRILWDTSARGYKDTIKKNLAWTDISSRLSQNSMYIFSVFWLIKLFPKSIIVSKYLCLTVVMTMRRQSRR